MEGRVGEDRMGSTDGVYFLHVLLRPKGENVDVKTVGMDEGSGECQDNVFIEHTLCW